MSNHPLPDAAGEPASTQKCSIGEVFQPIAHELACVEEKLAEIFRHSDEFIDGLLQHGGLLGGKRLRPALVLLAGKACGSVTKRHVAFAASLEMIHTATLVHDDILDEADMRRHVPTLHRHWSLDAGVLFGDYLLSRAFYLVATEVGGDFCTHVAEATNCACEGEMRQVAMRGDFEMSLTSYLEIIDGKTAAFCRCATRCGALLADAGTEAVAAAESYGTDLGIAFQIADDVLDLLGDERQTGKTTGRDYEMGKPTLPLILALDQVDHHERQSVLDRLHSGQLPHSELLRWLDQFDAIERARQMARNHARQAAARLDQFNGCCRSITALESLTESTVDRIR